MGGVFAGKNLRHVLESIRLHCDSVLRRLSPALRYRDNNVRITEDRPTPTKAGIWRLAVASLTGTLDSRRRQVRFCFQYFFYLLCRFFQWRAVLPHGGGHEARPQYTRRITVCFTRRGQSLDCYLKARPLPPVGCKHLLGALLPYCLCIHNTLAELLHATLQSPSNQCRMLPSRMTLIFFLCLQPMGGRDNYYCLPLLRTSAPCCDCMLQVKRL